LPTQTPVISYYFAEGYTGQIGTNGKATYTETLNILNPTCAYTPVTISYYSAAGGTPQVVNALVSPASELAENVNSDVGPDKMISAVVSSPNRIYVSRTINRMGTAGRLDGSTTVPASAPSQTWIFPEGYVGISFQEYLSLFNPGTNSANVTIQTAPQASSSANAPSESVNVPGLSRTTVNIRSLFVSAPVKSLGLIVNSDQPIVAERVEYFGDGSGSGKFGSTVATGVTSPASTLRIPFGSAGGGSVSPKGVVLNSGDEHYVTIVNPNSGSPVTVTMTYFSASGAQIGQPWNVSIAGGTRATFDSNPVVGPSNNPFSVAISSSGPVAAECVQYFGGSPNIGSHPGAAIPAASVATSDAYFSGLFTTLPDGTAVNRKVYLYNPGTTPVQVSGMYFPGTLSTSSASATPTTTATATSSATNTASATASVTPTPTGTATSTATPTPNDTATTLATNATATASAAATNATATAATNATNATATATQDANALPATATFDAQWAGFVAHNAAQTATAVATANLAVATQSATAAVPGPTFTPTPTTTGTATQTTTPTVTSTVTTTATPTITATPTSTPVTYTGSYTIPAGSILTVNVNSDAGTFQGPIGAEFKVVSGSSGSFVGYSIGTTSDGLVVDEDSAIPSF